MELVTQDSEPGICNSEPRSSYLQPKNQYLTLKIQDQGLFWFSFQLSDYFSKSTENFWEVVYLIDINATISYRAFHSRKIIRDLPPSVYFL